MYHAARPAHLIECRLRGCQEDRNPCSSAPPRCTARIDRLCREPRHTFRLAAQRPPARCAFLLRQGKQQLGRGGASGARDRSGGDARFGACDGISRRHAGQLLGGDRGRGAGASAKRRRRRVSSWRCPCDVQRAGHARRHRRPGLFRKQRRAAAFCAELRRREGVHPGRSRERQPGHAGVRVPGLRRAALQSADRDTAEAPAPARYRPPRMDRGFHEAGGGGIAIQATGRRGDARANERNDVRRRGSAPPRGLACRKPRLARRAARPLRRARARPDARRPGGGLDGGRARPTCRIVALGIARALCGNDRAAADAVSRPLAHAGCRSAAARHAMRRSRRWRRTSATTRKRRSHVPSGASSACRPRPGAAASGTALASWPPNRPPQPSGEWRSTAIHLAIDRVSMEYKTASGAAGPVDSGKNDDRTYRHDVGGGMQ